MTIEKLTGIDPVKNLRNTQKTRETAKPVAADTISLSPQAQKLSEFYLAMDVIKSMPDVRSEKISEVTKKLQDPAYIDNVLEETADKILESFGI